MRNTTFRAIGATAVLLGVAVAAMAQIGPGDPSAIEITSPVDTDSEPPRTSSTTALEPSFEYRIGLLAGVTTANFWEYIGAQPTAWNAYVLGPTKPALYGIDPATSTLVADLAASVPVQPTWDETGWRVRVDLDPDLSWSDGTPITASDIVYTFDTVRRLGLAGGWSDGYAAEIEDMVAESDTALRIELTKRPGLQVWPYGIGLAPIMPAHVWVPLTESVDTAQALYELDGTSDVSGGPLQVIEMNDGRIVSVVNPGYSQPAPETVIYAVYPSEADAAAALGRGEIDTILSPGGLSAESAESLGSVPGVSIENSPANSVRYLGFNLGRFPMSDLEFRQAVALLLDREAVTESLVPDASAAYTMLTPANEAWFDQERSAAIANTFGGDLATRLDGALSLLEQSGYDWVTVPAVVAGELTAGSGLTIDGVTPAPLTILTPGDEYDPARPDYTARIELALEALGFDVRPVVTDFDTVVDLAFSKDAAGVRQYDMYVLGWTLGNPLLPDFYRLLFASDGAVNSTGYANSDFDTQLAVY
ncbi:MAG TPA: ABC transporter substrate-binding protein, partial [Acidimicrobiia bacterium]